MIFSTFQGVKLKLKLSKKNKNMILHFWNVLYVYWFNYIQISFIIQLLFVKFIYEDKICFLMLC